MKMKTLIKSNGTDFDTWMVAVDQNLVMLTTMSSNDMADSSYWDNWDSDLDPVQGALEALSDQDFFTVAELQSMGWEG